MSENDFNWDSIEVLRTLPLRWRCLYLVRMQDRAEPGSPSAGSLGRSDAPGRRVAGRAARKAPAKKAAARRTSERAWDPSVLELLGPTSVAAAATAAGVVAKATIERNGRVRQEEIRAETRVKELEAEARLTLLQEREATKRERIRAKAACVQKVEEPPSDAA